MRWITEALECLQNANEAYEIRFMEYFNSAGLHANRATLMKKNLGCIKYLRMGHGIYPGTYKGPENDPNLQSTQYKLSSTFTLKFGAGSPHVVRKTYSY